MAHYLGFEFSSNMQALVQGVARVDNGALKGGTEIPASEFPALMSALVAIKAFDAAAKVAKAHYDANPRSIDAIYWHALAEVYAGRPDTAIGIAGEGLKTVGQKPQLFLVVGLAMLTVGSLENAGSTFQKAHTLNAGPIAVAYIGEVLRLMGKTDQAVACHQQCFSAGCRDAEAYYLAGAAYYDAGQTNAAIRHYQTALERKPHYIDAHDALNKALWEHGRRSEFMASFNSAVSAMPDVLELRLRQVHFLILSGELDAAEQRLEACLSEFGDNARIYAELANVKKQQDADFDAMPLYQKAYELKPGDHSVAKSHSRGLIAEQRYTEAKDVLSAMQVDQDSFDQECLAFLAACNSHLDPAVAAKVNDYEGLVQIYDLTPPHGYASMDDFNTAVLNALQPLHRTDTAPLEQTLVRGTQTHGMLFNSTQPEIKQLEAALKGHIRQYIQHLRASGPEEMRSRASADFEFSGAWSVQLSDEGYHVDHVHSAGWISSVYYVEVPDDLDDENHEGWLKFGDVSFDPGNTGPHRYVKPVQGRLVLFPSYMMHGTVPIREGKRRTTVAFDVVPK